MKSILEKALNENATQVPNVGISKVNLTAPLIANNIYKNFVKNIEADKLFTGDFPGVIEDVKFKYAENTYLACIDYYLYFMLRRSRNGIEEAKLMDLIFSISVYTLGGNDILDFKRPPFGEVQELLEPLINTHIKQIFFNA